MFGSTPAQDPTTGPPPVHFSWGSLDPTPAPDRYGHGSFALGGIPWDTSGKGKAQTGHGGDGQVKPLSTYAALPWFTLWDAACAGYVNPPVEGGKEDPSLRQHRRCCLRTLHLPRLRQFWRLTITRRLDGTTVCQKMRLVWRGSTRCKETLEITVTSTSKARRVGRRSPRTPHKVQVLQPLQSVKPTVGPRQGPRTLSERKSGHQTRVPASEARAVRASKLAERRAQEAELRLRMPRAAGQRPTGPSGSGRPRKRKRRLQEANSDTVLGARRRRSSNRTRCRFRSDMSLRCSCYRFMSVSSTLDFPGLGSPPPQGVG